MLIPANSIDIVLFLLAVSVTMLDNDECEESPTDVPPIIETALDKLLHSWIFSLF